MLALLAPASSSSQSKGSARGNQNNSKRKASRGKGGGKGGLGVMSFEQIMDLGLQESFPLFHSSYKEMCWKVQRRIRVPTQVQLHRLRQGREALQFLPLLASEAQLIIPPQTF